MEKNKKIWLWIGVALFVVPEALFSFLSGSIASLLGAGAWSVYSLLVGSQFASDHQGYLFIALFVECVGVFLTLIGNLKYNHTKWKNLFSVLLIFLFLFLFLVFYIGYVMNNISLL